MQNHALVLPTFTLLEKPHQKLERFLLHPDPVHVWTVLHHEQVAEVLCRENTHTHTPCR